jgi:CO/xanthine dehydrogenase FAD-binding subunit
MRPFEYVRPSSVEEACATLAGPPGEAKALAGGTDVLVQMKLGALRPRTVVSLRDVPGLDFVRPGAGGGLVIGAATPLATVEDSPLVREAFPAIAEAASFIGSRQVRGRATIGGNLCNAAPSADTAPILIVYDATAIVTDGRSERSVALADFFTGPGETVLRPGELLKAVSVPPSAKTGFGKYLKTFRSAMDCCTVGVAVFADLEPGSSIVREARIALGAVAPTPIRARRCEKSLVGRVLDESLIARAGLEAAAEAQPITDLRASAEYRKVLVEVLTRRALTSAREAAEKGGAR